MDAYKDAKNGTCMNGLNHIDLYIYLTTCKESNLYLSLFLRYSQIVLFNHFQHT